jgi:hypothetical protein
MAVAAAIMAAAGRRPLMAAGPLGRVRFPAAIGAAAARLVIKIAMLPAMLPVMLFVPENAEKENVGTGRVLLIIINRLFYVARCHVARFHNASGQRPCDEKRRQDHLVHGRSSFFLPGCCLLGIL